MSDFDVVFTLEQHWEVGLRSTYRKCLFWQKKNIYSNEVHFDLGGYVNKHNCHIWGTEKSHTYFDKPMHSKRAILWCRFWYRGITRPFFFENEHGEVVTVNLFICQKQTDNRKWYCQYIGQRCSAKYLFFWLML